METAGEILQAKAPAPRVSLDALTSLRFFAALAVVLYHSGAGFAEHSAFAPVFVVNALNNGWLGVPFFFILSGFIITYVHGDLSFDASQLAEFFLARFSRLYPVYLLSLALSAPFVSQFSPATDWRQFVFLQAWFPHFSATEWNFVSWTLSVEAFFYVLFPLLIHALRKLSDRALLIGLLLVAGLLALIWSNMTPELGNGELTLGGQSYFIPVPVLRAPEFIYGMFFGVVFLRGRFRLPGWTAYAALAIIALAATCSTQPAVEAVALIAFGPLIMALATSPKASAIRRLLDRPLLTLLGGASYSLYLLQFPVHEWIAAATPARLEFWGRLAFAPALILVSVLVYRGFEEPARRRLRKLWTPARGAGAIRAA